MRMVDSLTGWVNEALLIRAALDRGGSDRCPRHEASMTLVPDTGAPPAREHDDRAM